MRECIDFWGLTAAWPVYRLLWDVYKETYVYTKNLMKTKNTFLNAKFFCINWEIRMCISKSVHTPNFLRITHLQTSTYEKLYLLNLDKALMNHLHIYFMFCFYIDEPRKCENNWMFELKQDSIRWYFEKTEFLNNKISQISFYNYI